MQSLSESRGGPKVTKPIFSNSIKRHWQANTSVKISGSEIKGEQEHVRDIASIKRVTSKFHVVVVQNKSKEELGGMVPIPMAGRIFHRDKHGSNKAY